VTTVDVAFHGGAERLAVLAREAERRGHQGGLFVPEGAHDPYIDLAVAATASERVTLGTGIAVAFGRTPMATAYSAWDVQRLSHGRFVLGLGTQIRPHITRRFSMPWSRPAARMREYVAALRAIFGSWETGEPLAFEGDFYTHTLMPPLFSPGPVEGGPPPIWLAGVGPLMVAAAGSVADGLLCHPLISRAYLGDVVVPAVEAARDGREPFTLAVMTMVATGRTEHDLAKAIAGTRKQIGFYASTPAYAPVLEHHGWGDLHVDAHRFTKEGRWSELGDLVDDTVLHEFAVVGDLEAAGRDLRTRFTGLAERVMTSMPYDADDLLGLDLTTPTG
jgi:probable F420-dependent oxidoreductase